MDALFPQREWRAGLGVARQLRSVVLAVAGVCPRDGKVGRSGPELCNCV